MAEKEKSAAERRYGEKEKPKSEDKPERKETPKAEDKPEGDARGEMVKRHLKEARDLHGQHRDALKQMHARHETEMGAMGAQGAPEGQAEAEPAEAEE